MSLFYSNRIVLIHGNDGTDVRVGKICRSLSKFGFDMHFIGWDRRPQVEKTAKLGQSRTHIMTSATPYGKSTLLGNVLFTFHIMKILSKLRPQTVCCVNEEHALLVLPMRRLFYRYLVCDVFDALYDRHSYRNWILRNVLFVVGQIARTGADRLVATDQARFNTFGRHRAKSIIVNNYPEDPGEELANIVPEGPIRIYVPGTLTESGGLRQLLAAVEATEGVEIVSAGWLYDGYATNIFTKHPRVSFRGVVSADESLRLAAQSDAIFAFYEPKSINNLQASPNKVFDALCIGRPIIINKETEISRWVLENGLGYCLHYRDVAGLKNVLESLKKWRDDLKDYSRYARGIFQQGYNWEEMEPKLKKLYQELVD